MDSTVLFANYHTHTRRCHHAQGTDREYVENAIRAGIKILGFSDHTPMVYHTPGYYSGSKMKPEEAEDYFSSLSGLKKEYRDDIEIHIGLEVEYYPEVFDDFKKMIAPYPVEYFILGQHFLWREENKELSFTASDSEERLISYYKNLSAALDTGLFSCIAHPDCLNFTGDKAVYRKHTLAFLKTVKEKDIPLGLNRLGWAEKRHYPNAVFWESVAATGNKAIIELDAHSPQVFEDTKSIAEMRDFAGKNGIVLADTLCLPDNFPEKLKV